MNYSHLVLGEWKYKSERYGLRRFITVMFCATWYHLYNLKKHEKLPWRNVTFSKVAGFTKSNSPPWVFFTFFKLYKW